MSSFKTRQLKCSCCLSDEVRNEPGNLIGFAECLNCGFTFSISHRVGGLRDQIFKHYEQGDPHQQVALSKKIFFNKVLKHIESGEYNNRKLLDVGCGHGYFLNEALDYGWHCTGVEITDEGVRATKNVIGPENVFHGTLPEARYETDLFDAVTMWDVLFCMEDPETDLRECYRVLKTGGRIGLRLRNVQFQKKLYKAQLPVSTVLPKFGIKAPHVFHPQNFSKDAIESLLQRIGFRVIQIRNAPLTKGDPYRYSKFSMITGLLKTLINFSANLLFYISGGRKTVGPSLLVWAEKPAM